MALEKTRQREIHRQRSGGVEGPLHTPVATQATTPATTTPTTTQKATGAVQAVEVSEGDKAKLGQRSDKAPVATSTAGNARDALMMQVQARRDEDAIGTEGKKLLRHAYKELSKPGATLDDHLALRASAAEQGPAAGRAFDEIMKANAGALFPQLVERAHVFDGAAKLRELREVATAMGMGASFDAHVTQQLVMARSWSKGDDAASVRARAEVDAFAQQMGLVLPEEATGSGRVYEASPKHHGGAVDGAYISPAPTNGQKVLDASVQVKPESPRRVGVDKEAKEYVIFDETVATVFHGHRRSWDKLHPDMQRALVDAGLCNNSGKIL